RVLGTSSGRTQTSPAFFLNTVNLLENLLDLSFFDQTSISPKCESSPINICQRNEVCSYVSSASRPSIHATRVASEGSWARGITMHIRFIRPLLFTLVVLSMSAASLAQI